MESTKHISKCPNCGASNIKRCGTTSTGVQRYICKDCKKSFAAQSAVLKQTK